MFLPGMVRHGKERVALTFDACGGTRGSGYDKKIISTLRKKNVPATLFLNSRWIDAHPHVAADLADDPLFELGNHGWLHRPLTVAGQTAYGIKGTSNPGEAYDEIMRGLHAVAELTGRTPTWYRPGTAWADDIGVAIAQRLGLRVIAFSINADAGATASKKEVVANLKRARRTDITLAHVNQPTERPPRASPRSSQDDPRRPPLRHPQPGLGLRISTESADTSSMAPRDLCQVGACRSVRPLRCPGSGRPHPV